MAQPTPKVYLAFNQSPYTASPTWTEITSYVMSADTYRGRDNDWEDTQAGTATIVLNNNTRTFDPAYTAGTYYGQLIPRMQIKITGTISATEYDVFRGYVAGWPVQYDNAGATSTVTLSCYDALGLLAQDELPADWADEYIKSLNPVHYYKMNDIIVPPITAATQYTDYGSWGGNMTRSGSLLSTRNVPQLAPGLLGNCASISSGEMVYRDTVNVSVFISHSTTAWYQITGSANNQICNDATYGYRSYFYYDEATPNYLYQYIDDGATNAYRYRANYTIDISSPHHFAFTYEAGVAFKRYIYGQEVAFTFLSLTTIPGGAVHQMAAWPGQNQQFCLFNGVLTSDQIKTIYTLSQATFYETTSARNARILANSAFPAGLKSISATSTTYVSEITDDSPNLTAELQLNNRSEGGLCFVSKSGVLTTKSRYEQFAYGYTDQLPLTSSTDTGFDTSINISLDADQMANDVAVTWTNGNIATVTNAASIAAYGQKQKPVTTQISSYNEAIALANMQVGLGQYPRPKLSEHRVNPANNSATWAAILDMELYERYSLAVAPKVGNATNYSLLMQSVSHRIEPGRWECRFKGSNIYASAFRLDVSLLNGPDVLLYAQ
jgi:hypothetical protein